MEKEILADENLTYLEGGRALMAAQNLEMHLQTLIVIQQVIRADHKGASSVEELYNMHDKKPLGRLLGTIREYVEFESEFDEKLKEALETRNWVVHRSYSDIILRYGGEQAKIQGPIELKMATQKISEVSVKVLELTIKMAAAIGLTPEKLNKELKRIEAGITVDWPSNS